MEAVDMQNELTLSRLINLARRGGEVSYERLSKACGGTPTAKRLHQFENGELKNFPDPETLRALARGTGFSVTEIIMAAGRSLGLPVTDDDPDTLRIYGISQAPEKAVNLLRDLGREVAQLAAEASATPEPAAPGELTQDMLDLASHKGDRHVGPHDLPYE